MTYTQGDWEMQGSPHPTELEVIVPFYYFLVAEVFSHKIDLWQTYSAFRAPEGSSKLDIQ